MLLGEKEGNVQQKQLTKAILLCGSVLLCGVAAWFGPLGWSGSTRETTGAEWSGVTPERGGSAGDISRGAGSGKNGEAAEWQARKGKGAEVTVCVSGAVQRPGLYKVPKGTRARDVLLLAGGYTFDADPDRVNLARACKDGTHIRVPRLSQKRLRERLQRPRG